MKQTSALLIIFLCIYLSVNAQTSVYQKTFGGTDYDWGFAVIATADGGYAMAGSSQSFGAGGLDVLLVKLDASANLQWSHLFGGAGSDEAISLVQCTDGGYAICGKTSSYGAGGFDALLIKTNSAGNTEWMKTYGGVNEERLLHLRQTSDNGFILAGSTSTFGQGSWDMMYIKTNSTGDTLWTKIIGGAGYDQGTDAAQTADGGYIISGREESWGAGFVDIFLAKLNANGDTTWTRAYGSTNWDEGMKVMQTYDGGYIIAGGSNSFTNASYDAYLNKVDSSGHLTWSKIYSGIANDATYDVVQLEDSGYVIVGETDSYGANHLKTAHHYFNVDPLQKNINPGNHIFGSDHSNILMIRTTATGDTVWARAYGGPVQDEGYGLIRTNDNGLMAGAYTRSFGSDSIDFYLIKTDITGYSGCNEDFATTTIINPLTIESNTSALITSGLTVTNVAGVLTTALLTQNDVCFSTSVNEQSIPTTSIAVNPNPFTSTATVEIQHPTNFTAQEVSIVDVCGRELKNFKADENGKIQLNSKDFNPGIYFLNVYGTDSEKKIMVLKTKFVVE